MKYPSLVPEKLCKTDIRLWVESEELNEDGEAQIVAEFAGKCNYQDEATMVLTYEKKMVQISGKALFTGDIFPHVAVIAGGKAEIFGEKRRILKGRKARNPDGTVNFTEVLLK